jgi:hypothetical protein
MAISPIDLTVNKKALFFAPTIQLILEFFWLLKEFNRSR